MTSLEDLRQEWKTLYATTLPQMAKAQDPAQSKWPVTLDHCFARIILDSTIGRGEQQWDQVLPKPAVRNMNENQLQEAIALGLRIIAGDVDLCQLDQSSLQSRGKNEKKYAMNTANPAEERKEKQLSPLIAGIKRSFDERENDDRPKPKKSRRTEGKQSTLDSWKPTPPKQAPEFSDAPRNSAKATHLQLDTEEIERILGRIQSHPSLTPYRKRLYTILLSVPEGRYTTYAAMSDYLKSSARAVGNGMRNNPFAPEVPCHRVLAADGSIGGFYGSWGKDGKHATKKIELLRSEGIKFDGKGKVVGEPFRKFDEFLETAEEDVSLGGPLLYTGVRKPPMGFPSGDQY